MDILQWTPVVFQTPSRPGQSEPALEIRAWMRCLFCGSVTEVVTAPFRWTTTTGADGKRHKLPERTGTMLDRPESKFHACAEQIKRHRKCGRCGFVSGLPDIQTERLKKEMLRLMNDEWFEAQLKASEPIFAAASQEIVNAVKGEVAKLFSADIEERIRRAAEAAAKLK